MLLHLIYIYNFMMFIVVYCFIYTAFNQIGLDLHVPHSLEDCFEVAAQAQDLWWGRKQKKSKVKSGQMQYLR